MAAILIPAPETDATERPVLDRRGPGFTVIEGGRSDRHLATMYRRRRIAAALVALVARSGRLGLVQAALRRGHARTPRRGGRGVGLGAHRRRTPCVVHAGDSYWSIARRFHPNGDVRSLVDRLSAAHGSAPLQPGMSSPSPESGRAARRAGRRGSEGLGGPVGGSVVAVRCPACASLDDKVVDSRSSDDDTAIRRRRECLGCGRRFTTFERVEEVALVVIKRSGDREPFDREKIVAGLRSAAKNRPITASDLEQVAVDVEDSLRIDGPDVESEQVGRAVLDALAEVDQVAYLRFASVYKEFEDAGDFERELRLLTKSTAPKHH